MVANPPQEKSTYTGDQIARKAPLRDEPLRLEGSRHFVATVIHGHAPAVGRSSHRSFEDHLHPSLLRNAEVQPQTRRPEQPLCSLTLSFCSDFLSPRRPRTRTGKNNNPSPAQGGRG
jgi:hypothetical protein